MPRVTDVQPTPDTVPEIVALFRSSDALEAAINDLSSAGWDRSEMSLLTQKHVLLPEPPQESTMHEAAAAPQEGKSAIVSDSDVRQGRTLATSLAGVIGAFAATGATILTGGTALAALAGAAVAGGGAAAVVNALGQWADKSRSQYLQDQVERGGILLWLTPRDPEQEHLAHDILTRHGAEIIDPEKLQLSRSEAESSRVDH
jgi:hypothetical protein